MYQQLIIFGIHCTADLAAVYKISEVDFYFLSYVQMLMSVPRVKTSFKWFLQIEGDELYTGICYSTIQ